MSGNPKERMNIIATKIHDHPVHFATLAKSRGAQNVAHVFDHPQIRIADEQRLKRTGFGSSRREKKSISTSTYAPAGHELAIFRF